MRISKTRISKIAAVASLALCLGTPAFAAEPQVPRLDVTPTCRPLDKSDMMQFDENRCRKIENDARDQLVRQWANYPTADRSQCIATATMGGAASYVELITCLEMKHDVASLPASGLRSRPTGLGTTR
jgi:hypothetical protein